MCRQVEHTDRPSVCSTCLHMFEPIFHLTRLNSHNVVDDSDLQCAVDAAEEWTCTDLYSDAFVDRLIFTQQAEAQTRFHPDRGVTARLPPSVTETDDKAQIKMEAVTVLSVSRLSPPPLRLRVEGSVCC